MRTVLKRLLRTSTCVSVALLSCVAMARPVDNAFENNAAENKAKETSQVLMQTSKGDIVIQLDQKRAPQTVKNFLTYVDEGYYDGLVFHRVIPGFMIQGGGFHEAMVQKSTRPAIYNESSNGLSNKRGTIAMARTQAPHSATSQFYINLENNPSLDARGGQPGYAVFGEVVSGMDTVDAIARVKTGLKSGHSDVPVEPVTIVKARRVVSETKNSKPADKAAE